MKNSNTTTENFNPLKFLASLGAGGIAVIPFALMQYAHHTGKGLISLSQVGHGSLSLGKEAFFIGLEAIMIIFAILHFALTIKLLRQFIPWLKTKTYGSFINDPLKNSAILAPFISIGMSFNLIIGAVRFFVPALSNNLQLLMLPALIAWAILWVLLLRMEIKLLKISFSTSFDMNKINFGWLLHPFALGMTSVIGAGIAALSKDPTIAHTAAFMTTITMTMGLFLLLVKTVAIFKSHFNATGLPAKQFLPSLLIVVPNITLYALTAFRLIHYMEHQHGAHIHWLGQAVVILSFAFEIWYMAFGIAMLKDYFKNHFFNKEFHVTQWGLICPFVATSVLGSFFYKVFVPNPISYGLVLVSMIVAITAFSMLMAKSLKCSRVSHQENHT